MKGRLSLRPCSGARCFAPEVVQSSAMDCGPATLSCLAEGFSIPVSYDRLREACQTGVDGTSIDALEAVACQLGLQAEQIMLPPDWVLLPEAMALPAILVVRNPIGATHFLVVWNRYGSWVQVMDPATGRRWLRADRLLAETYVHSLRVSAEAWRDWASSEEAIVVLGARLTKLGLGGDVANRLLDEALADPGWRGLAALDAAARMAAALIRAKGLRSGAEAGALIRESLRSASLADGAVAESIPSRYWSVREIPPAPAGAPYEAVGVELRGAVLVRARGKCRKVGRGVDQRDEAAAVPSPELAAALDRPRSRPLRSLWNLALEPGLFAPAAIGSAVLMAAALTVLEALIFRGFLDLASKLALREQRLLAAGALLVFLVLLLLLEVPLFGGTLQISRRIETLLRRKFLLATAAQPDRYFRSRLSSDLAERCHSVHRLHDAPEVGARVLRTFAQVAFVAVGVSLLDPASAAVAFAAAAVAVGLPLAAQPILGERDLRVRDHAGALGRFYLDSLLGIVPVRSHGAERAVQREHEGLLTEWVRGANRFERAALHLDWLTATAGYGFAVWLVFRYVAAGGAPTGILLLTYWALLLPNLGMELSISARQVPLLRNVARRLLEPISSGAEEDGGRSATDSSEVAEEAASGVSIELEGLRVVAAGHTILEDLDLQISAGQHVAVVGASGAGKSSLVGLLLGWHPPDAGRLRIDGRDLGEDHLDRLRRETAWVDPSVQLWNRSLLANLLYGAPPGAEAAIGACLQRAELAAVIEGLPDGMATLLGEGGALVSGGEGQRVRLGRSLLRSRARLVILDEAFRGLDRVLRRRLLRQARDWWRGATLICITHDLHETLSFDRVLVLDSGRIVEQGNPREARGSAGIALRGAPAGGGAGAGRAPVAPTMEAPAPGPGAGGRNVGRS